MNNKSNLAKQSEIKQLNRRDKYLNSLFQDNVGMKTGVLISKGLRDETGLKPGASIGENPVLAHLPMIQSEKADADYQLLSVIQGNNQTVMLQQDGNSVGGRQFGDGLMSNSAHESLQASHQFLQNRQGQHSLYGFPSSQTNFNAMPKNEAHDKSLKQEESKAHAINQKNQLLDLKQKRMAGLADTGAPQLAEQQDPQSTSNVLLDFVPSSHRYRMIDAQKQKNYKQIQLYQGHFSHMGVDLGAVRHLGNAGSSAVRNAAPHHSQAEDKGQYVNLQHSLNSSFNSNSHDSINNEIITKLMDHTAVGSPQVIVQTPSAEISPIRDKDMNANPNQVSAKISVNKQVFKKHKEQHGLLSLSMQIEPGNFKNLNKFERQIDNVFVKRIDQDDKSRKRYKYHQSIDFPKGSLKQMVDLQNQDDNLVNYKSKLEKNFSPTFQDSNVDLKMKSHTQRDSIEKQRQMRRSSAEESPSRRGKNSALGRIQLFPSINTSNLVLSLREGEKSPKKNHGISTVDGTTMMSYREQGFYTAKEKAQLKIGEQRRNVHNSFVLQSNHYKYNRIKEGGWGAINRQKHDILPCISASRNLQNCATEQAEKIKLENQDIMHSLGRLATSDIMITNALKNEQVFGRIEQQEFQASHKNRQKLQHFHAHKSKNDRSRSHKKDEAAKQAVFNKQTSSNDGGISYTQYHIQSQEEMNQQKTMPLTSALRHKNQSNVSFRTEKTFLNNQQREKYLASQNQNILKMSQEASAHQQATDPDRMPSNMLNLTMNMDSSQYLGQHQEGQSYANKTVESIEAMNSQQKLMPQSDKRQASLAHQLVHGGVQTSYDSFSQSHLNLQNSHIRQKQDAQMSQQHIYEKNLLMEQLLQQDSSGIRITDAPKSADSRDGQAESLDGEYYNRGQRVAKNALKSVDQLKIAEKSDKQSFNDQFEKLHSKHSSIVKENIEEKLNVRRQREQLLKQIKLVQAQTKEKKRQIEVQRQMNNKSVEQFNQQVDLFKRLSDLFANHLVLDQQQGHIPDVKSQDSLLMTSRDGIQDDVLRQIQGRAAQLDSGLDAFINESQSIGGALAGSTDRSAGQMSLVRSPQSILNVKSKDARHDIHGFYKFLFENDLKSTKERTLQQLESVKELNDYNLKESEVLKFENDQLRKFVKRYQKMADEFNDKEGSFEPNQLAIAKSTQLLQARLQRKAQDQLNMDQINQSLYKYGDAAKNKHEETKSSFYGNMTSNTPATNLNYRTHMSFAGGRAPTYMDLRKAETITLHMPSILRQARALDSIVQSLQMIKDVFKAQKVTLFIIDPDLQGHLFQNKQERKQNYKKLIMGGNSLIYAIFLNENDFAGPIFKDIDGASNHMFNNKVIIIPLKEQKKTKMSLQIVYDEKMKVGKSGASPKKNKANKKELSVGRKDNSSRQRNNGSKMSSNSPGKKANSGTTSQKSLRGGVAGGQNIPGWNKNDYNLMKILANFLYLNVDYFSQQVITKAKERKIFDIIDFSLDIMQVESYRQLVKKFKHYIQSLVGFKECALFFEDPASGELFTVADLDSQQDADKKKSSNDTSFAKELYFTDDQIVIFPPTIGITGEVHEKKGFRFQNNFGQLVKSQDNEDFDDGQSQRTSYSYSRRSSMRIQQKQLLAAQMSGIPKNAHGNLDRILKTKLEQIKEDAPQAENEAINNQIRRSIRDKDSKNHLLSSMNVMNQQERDDQNKFDQIEIASNESSPINDRKRVMDQSPGGLELGMRTKTETEPPADGNKNGISNFGSYLRKIENTQTSDKRDVGTENAQTPVPGQKMEKTNSGNIMDLAIENKRVKKNISKNAEAGMAPEERYFAEFVPDIDNFVGVKTINNYVIVSMKDDGYKFGEKSVGILQLYNKNDGKNISKEDVARLKWIAWFIGSLSIKCQYIASSRTQAIRFLQKEPKFYNRFETAYKEDFDPSAQGVVAAIGDAVELIDKQLGLEPGNEEDYNAEQSTR